jgi:peptidoglycan/LPS O-acetylase OafA/YrhL
MFILAIAAWNGTYVSEPFRSPWMLITFLAVLIPASLLCFRLFEVPARKALRSALLLRQDSPKAQYETRAL